MSDLDLFELKPDQKRALERMRRAYEDCIKLGLVFYNNFGSIGTVDKERFNPDFYNDIETDNAIYDDGLNMVNEINGLPVSWADDNHWFHPKEK